jgi:hypothetical protein
MIIDNANVIAIANLDIFCKSNRLGQALRSFLITFHLSKKKAIITCTVTMATGYLLRPYSFASLPFGNFALFISLSLYYLSPILSMSFPSNIVKIK